MAALANLGLLPQRIRRRKSQSTAQIYIDDLMEEYTCPICFDEIEKCMMTPCGHNFCKKCIDECLNRKHICPFCSTECTQDKLIRNVHLDAVLSRLVRARTEASQQLVSNLMQKSIEESAKCASTITFESPIAKILMKYTSSTLVKYENHYQDMLRENRKNELRLQKKLYDKLSILMTHNNDRTQALLSNILDIDGDLNENISRLISYIKSSQIELKMSDSDLNEIETCLSVYSESIQLYQKRVSKSCKLLFESFEEYMKKTGPSPFLLPVSVTIRLRGRPQFWDLKLNATDQIGVVLDIVKQKFIDLGDAIDTWQFDIDNQAEGKQDEKIALGVLRPLGDRDPEKPLEIINDMEICLTELNVMQGTQLHLLTNFVLKSEAPRPCFTYNYDKSKGNQTCDYYRCKTCGFNWVCKPCSQQCHKTHDLVPFMMDHAPSYACCYCVKKKKCKILNVKSKKN